MMFVNELYYLKRLQRSYKIFLKVCVNVNVDIAIYLMIANMKAN